MRGRPGRVVAAKTYAPDGDVLGVEVSSVFDPVAHRFRRALVVAADRYLILGFALSGPIDGERRHAAGEEWFFVRMQLLFGGVEPRRHDDHGTRAAQYAENGFALERDGDAFAGPGP